MIRTDVVSTESATSPDDAGNRWYKNCISLGCACGTASSMSRIGLRNHSGPFDWFVSDLEPVLKLMETDFSDFMAKENLFADADNPLVFHDRKYGFPCNHDIQHDFETEYEKINQKYMRRACRFMQDIKQPTCFIRAVRSEEEVSYIEENREYIYHIVKKGNSNNEIIFLLLNTMRELPDDFLWFRLGIEQYIGHVYEMRTMFDTSETFSEYCRHNILSPDRMEQNKRFDRENASMKVKIGMMIRRMDVYDVASVLNNYYADIEKGIYLMGAGFYGELFSLYLIEQGINVKGIIDNNQEKQGSLCNGIPIISFSQVLYDDENICITVANNKIAEIEKQILDKYPNTRILTLSKIVDLLGKEIFLYL